MSMRSIYAWVSVTTKVGCLVAGLSHSIPSLWLQQGSFPLSQLAAFQLGGTVGPSLACTIPTTLWAKPHSLTHFYQMWIIEVKSLSYWLTVCLYDWCVSRGYRNTHNQSELGWTLLSESRGYHCLAWLKVWVPGNWPPGNREEVKRDQMIIAYLPLHLLTRKNIFWRGGHVR